MSNEVDPRLNLWIMRAEHDAICVRRGLWLRNDGKGTLESVRGQESGIKAYGEGRGLALGDYDREGRLDLVMGQNGAETKLYRNVRGKAGLRVRLQGEGGNVVGIGATVRVGYGSGRMGPAKEVHAGSGYGSQDSSVLVFGLKEVAKELWVRWPGGKMMTVALPAGTGEVTVDAGGKVVGER